MQAINSMLLDMLAAIARTKAEGRYLSRPIDQEKRKIIASLLKSGHTYSDI